MDRFSKFHPAVGFSFFSAVIIISLVFVNPVYSAVSFVSAFAYYVVLCRKKAVLSFFKFVLPLVAAVALFNMLFCRYGQTILFTAFSLGFTLEALVYGLLTGLMLGSVIMWFLCYNEVVSSEKFTSLFGRFAPNLTLLFSMVLRFIPLMIKTSGEIKDAQTGLGNETKGLKNTIERFSALVSISLENSIETADTMKSRGFGEKRRHFSRYSYKITDVILIVFFLLSLVLQIVFKAAGLNEFEYRYELEMANFSIPPFIAFALCSFLPCIIDLKEDVKWHFLKSKI